MIWRERQRKEKKNTGIPQCECEAYVLSQRDHPKINVDPTSVHYFRVHLGEQRTAMNLHFFQNTPAILNLILAHPRWYHRIQGDGVHTQASLLSPS
jgi:hypothetical protein